MPGTQGTPTKFAALIITAGTTPRRDGFDPMQKIGSLSAVQRLIMTFHLAGVGPIVVAVSQDEQVLLEKHARRTGVEFLRSDPQAEMFHNVCLGLRHLQGRCEAVLVTPVDIPLFSVETVSALTACGHPLACPVCEGQKGHPLLIGQQVVPDILAYTGDSGLAGAARECADPLTLVEVADPGVYVRSDQFEECEKIAATQGRAQWRPLMKLRIARETPFLGPGSWQLLSLIETTGSVRTACSQMGISYSKAWKILNNMEEQVGYAVLHRQPGGRNGGETHLTEQGKRMLEQYERFERECHVAVNKIFKKHYGSE